jgi:hypothetical protein
MVDGMFNVDSKVYGEYEEYRHECYLNKRLDPLNTIYQCFGQGSFRQIRMPG